jgi:hypothetical protein
MIISFKPTETAARKTAGTRSNFKPIGSFTVAAIKQRAADRIGICVSCGANISAQILEQDPDAMLCATCQAAFKAFETHVPQG